jgi:hypothetical protein
MTLDLRVRGSAKKIREHRGQEDRAEIADPRFRYKFTSSAIA